MFYCRFSPLQILWIRLFTCILCSMTYENCELLALLYNHFPGAKIEYVAELRPEADKAADYLWRLAKLAEGSVVSAFI